MEISIQDAAYFMQLNHPVLDELHRRREESFTDAELGALISREATQASPQYVLTRLKELKFIRETDSQAGEWELEASFGDWIDQLKSIAHPVSSQLVNGRLNELEHLRDSFRAAQESRDLPQGREVLGNARRGFQSLAQDLLQTRLAIATAVAEAKCEHRKQGTRERFRRINRMWTEYLMPMLELLNPTGRLEALCLGWERLLGAALECGFLPERRLAERIEREMQVLRVTLRVSFRDCRHELEPLHAQLRRDSHLSEGAASIIASIEKSGANGSPLASSLPLSHFRFAGQIAQSALEASAARFEDFSAPPEAIDFKQATRPGESESVEELLATIDSLPNEAFPIPDLLQWLAAKHERHGFNALLQVFSLLVTDDSYHAAFEYPISEYAVAGGTVRCGQVTLKRRQAA